MTQRVLRFIKGVEGSSSAVTIVEIDIGLLRSNQRGHEVLNNHN